MEHVLCDYRRGERPADEQRDPREEVDHGQLLHHRRHLRQIAEYVSDEIVARAASIGDLCQADQHRPKAQHVK